MAWVQGYGYDSMMRLGTVTSPAGGTFTSPTGTFTYTYSGAGDRVQQAQFPAFPSSSSLYIQNQYDSLARLTNTYVSSPLSGTVDLHGFVYDPGSEVTQQVFTAGNYINYSYDNIGQLKLASGKSLGGTTNRLQEQFGYAYDKAWNLNDRTNNGLVQTFSVNDLNELSNLTNNGAKPVVSGSTTSPATNVTVNSLVAALYTDSTFAVTNLTLTSGLNTLSATARDTNNRVSSSSIQVNVTGSANYLYDTNGNLTSDGTRSFAYDVENELVSVWQTNVWREDFTYDGLQRRRITTEYAWVGSSWLQTNEVFYIYDGNLVFQERDQNNLPLTTYTRGLDLSGTLQGAGGIGGLLARSDKEQVVPNVVSINNPHPQYVISSYYHSDGNGNVTLLIQPNGLAVASYEYDPCGNILSMSGMIAGANKYRFSSKELNENSGLIYYGRRFYDSNLQRWLNRDPIQELGGYNLYTFISNVSVNSVDAFGLCDNNSGVPDSLNPKSPPYDPYDPSSNNWLRPFDSWPPNMPPPVDQPPSKNPVGDFGSGLGKAANDMFGNTAKQYGQNAMNSLRIGSNAENLGTAAAAAAINGAKYALGQKASLGYNFNAFGGTCSINASIEKGKKGQDLSIGVKYGIRF